MAVAQDKKASQLTVPVAVADTDFAAGVRPASGGDPNLDIQLPVGLIRAPIIDGLAAGDVPVAAKGVLLDGGLPLTAKLAGATGPGPLVAQIGDSRHANGILNASPAFGRTMQSAGSWIEFLTHGRVRCPVSYNMAVGGTGTADLDGQITNVLALSPLPTHCAILVGTNTINNATSATGLMATMQAQTIAAWQRLLRYGITPIQTLDLPREWATTTLTAAVKRSLHNEYNNWLRAVHRQYRVLIVDPVWKLTDPAKATGECLTSLYYSELPLKIHPGPMGSYIVGNLYKDLFEGLGLPPRYVGLGRGDVYDATNNQRGNLIAEGGVFYSSGGSLAGANPPTGTVGLGLILRNDTGAASLVSCVGSLEARTDGPGNWQKVVASVDGSGPGATILVYNQGTFNCAIGDTVEFGIDIEFDSSSVANQCAVAVEDRTTAGAAVNQGQYGMQFGSVADIGAFQSTFSGRAITPPLTLGANFVVLRYLVSIQLNPSSTITFRLGAASLRKVL